MKEFIEKLIGRLEEESDYEPIDYDYCDMSCSGEEHFISTHKAIEIVNQLAEEYKPCNKPSCKDCEVYDKEKHYCPKWCEVIKHTTSELAEEHNSGWIPCSERFPEEEGEYLTYVDYDDDCFIAIDEFLCQGLLAGWNCTPNYRVLAWQPLPAPYQPKGE